VERMKYYITYSITNPQYTPTTATGMVEAGTRRDLEVRLERGVELWKKQGYMVEIIKVASIDIAQPIISK